MKRGRSCDAVAHGTVAHDGSVGQADGPAGAGGEIGIMRDQDERGADAPVELAHELHDHVPGAGIEVAGRLVGKEDAGPVGERPRQRHALLLAAGKLGRVMMFPAGQAHAGEQLSGAGLDRFRPLARARAPGQLQWNLDVLQGRQGGDELERLEDEAHPVPPEPRPGIFVQLVQIGPVEQDPAAARMVQSGKQAQQRRLAAAGWPHDRQEATRLQMEGDILEHGQIAAAGDVGLRDLFTTEHVVYLKSCGVRSRATRIISWAVALPVIAAAGCTAGERSPDRAEEAPPVRTESPSLPDERAAVVFLGTSLTAGLGLDPSEAYPARIQQRIDEAGLPFSVVNAGVSGETSAGARQRIDWLLQRPVSVLVVETGANDGLRGLDPAALRLNLDAILAR